uniref:Secreted protein n=1 Tax=Caenorhabditis tropicalis TaxID=1561998 RepID=A0A1I7T2B4_9PELO
MTPWRSEQKTHILLGCFMWCIPPQAAAASSSSPPRISSFFHVLIFEMTKVPNRCRRRPDATAVQINEKELGGEEEVSGAGEGHHHKIESDYVNTVGRTVGDVCGTAWLQPPPGLDLLV